MDLNLTEVFVALISLIGIIITSIIVPWIKSKTTAQQQDIVRTLTTVAVYAAQQLFDSEQADEKKEYALQQVSEGLKKYHISLSSEQISTYIEGVLKNIKTSFDANNTSW